MGWMSQVCGDNEHDYIEVDKKYLGKLERNSKALEIYKKALELMAEQYAFQECGTVEQVIEHYLQKAREE